MTTLGSIKALRKANASQHRLIEKLYNRTKELEVVVEAARLANFIMDDAIEYLKPSDGEGKRIYHNLVKAKGHLVSMALKVNELEEV